jgi:uncharacterized protein with von Willebrand factor type A (vWA) domain
MSRADEPLDVPRVLLGLARALRAAGLPVGADRARSFAEAAAVVGAGDRAGVYWAGRATLCSEPGHRDVYDAVFPAWFAAWTPPPGVRPAALPARRAPAGLLEQPEADPGAAEPEAVPGTATPLEVLRHRDVATLTEAERSQLARLFSVLRPVPPARPSRRRLRSRSGDLDPRGTLRELLRTGGEPVRPRHRRAATRPRRVVLLLDVSGSMSPYAEALLRLAHVWVRAAPGVTEVFTVGTRLTRITRALRLPHPEEALRQAGEQVPDWSGGTRLADVLGAFLARWGQGSTVRGAVVVLCSDGWERGDPAGLGERMARLSRLAHRVVWVNPHRGKDGYRPVQGGMSAALPHVDHFLAGHSLDTFVRLAEVVARA